MVSTSATKTCGEAVSTKRNLMIPTFRFKRWVGSGGGCTTHGGEVSCLGLGLIGTFAGTRWRGWWLVESASAVARDLGCRRGTVSQWRQEAEVKLVRSSKGGTVQADQARRARAAQAVLAEITPFSPLITYPKTLPSFRKTFIREHQHFLTQTYSHPETYSQGEATNLQSGRTQIITTSANVLQNATTMQRKS